MYWEKITTICENLHHSKPHKPKEAGQEGGRNDENAKYKATSLKNMMHKLPSN